MKAISTLTTIFLIFLMSSTTLARLNAVYEVKTFIQKGKKSKQTDATLYMEANSFRVIPDKGKYKSQMKVINYSDITQADYSYAKKPLLSTGGAITSVILLGVFAVPFLFMKKKQHWLSIRAGENFAVLRLKKDNFRQVVAEFDSKRVAVKTVDQSNAADLEKAKKEQEAKEKPLEQESAGEKAGDGN